MNSVLDAQHLAQIKERHAKRSALTAKYGPLYQLISPGNEAHIDCEYLLAALAEAQREVASYANAHAVLKGERITLHEKVFRLQQRLGEIP